ncbi:hypothetical protein [Microbacterium sp. E-13]|uniref:hypothetical protein n=1 Tax=Microbacterium sp. E-13 TaxID=3404048 RepID=UPI003CEC0C31
MGMDTLARRSLLVAQGFVAVTAIAGGTAIVVGAMSPAMATVLSPPPAYLEGSPFSSYLVPGLALAGLLGGIHVVAFITLLRRYRWSLLISAAAAFATLIWIFVQMMFIPFSFLQAVYFVAGLAEAGLIMVLLGLFTRPATAGQLAVSTALPVSTGSTGSAT